MFRVFFYFLFNSFLDCGSSTVNLSFNHAGHLLHKESTNTGTIPSTVSKEPVTTRVRRQEAGEFRVRL